MAAPDAAARGQALAYLDRQLKRIAYLRATGPNPFDYFLWADESTTILAEVYGTASDEVQAFRLAVADSGRTADQRGILDNMTLGLHGDWGIWARLDRGESALRQIMARAG